MKRSQINALMRDAVKFFRQHGFYLPPFAYWTPEGWAEKGEKARKIVECRLGWDITDFGLDNFETVGLVLFTLRNGNLVNLTKGQGRCYAEKIMLVGVDQVTPLHFHFTKTEDIVNRGGGKLAIQLYNSSSKGEQLSDIDVIVEVNSITQKIKAGGTVLLNPGESITVSPRLYHKLWGVENRVLVGEVSTVNDDDTDNYFHEPVSRFPTIDEDKPALYLLVRDYQTYYRPQKLL